MIRVLLNQNIRALARYLLRDPVPRLITLGAFALVFLAVAAGIFVFIRGGLAFITQNDFFAEALPLYIYELFFLAVMYVAFASALVTVMSQLFRERQDDWIMAAPVYGVLPRYTVVRVLVTTALPFSVLVIPALVAMDAVFRVNPFHFLFAFIAVIMFLSVVVVAAFAVVLFALKAMQLLRAPISRGSFAAAVALLFVLLSFISWGGVPLVNLAELFGAADIERAEADVAAVNQQFRVFPSHHAAALVHGVQTGSTEAVFVHGSYIAAMLVVLLGLLRVSEGGFLLAWQRFSEGGVVAQRENSLSHQRPRFPFLYRGLFGILVGKEVVSFFRNARSVLWFGFLCALWAAQIGFDVILTQGIGGEGVRFETLPAVVQSIQILLIVYFVAAIVLRFVFPVFSAERDTAWLLMSSPVSRQRIFVSKLLFFGTGMAALSLLAALFHAETLDIPFIAGALFLALAAVSSFWVTVFGLSLGALFPNFETDDPEVLSTSLPGLAFIVGSLLYGALGAWALYAVIVEHVLRWVFVFVVLSLLSAAFVARRAIGKLARQEFAAVQV